ncbi:hypothetical protein [Aquimarina sp. MAR_2010_214]|uniref:hypothetical protein n=1 Tax=Aquimarina sp. MAR_2010_214 TaxID=1250026 RepID=UPI000C70D18A|nr:hypothetical protein [Aquimarina sp. MAR_2010_214]
MEKSMVDTRRVHYEFSASMMDTYESDDFYDPENENFGESEPTPLEMIELAIKNDFLIDSGATKTQLESFKDKFTDKSTWEDAYNIFEEVATALKNAKSRGEKLEGWNNQIKQGRER